MNVSPCGINCDVCPLQSQCGDGCQASGGKPFYIQDFGVERCPIYDCAVKKNGYQTCGECAELPCQLFYDWKDPSMSDEEHRKAVDANVAFLAMMNKAFCQSCGMPLEEEALFGRNMDGGKNNDYCVYCFKDGAFMQDVTMSKMIDISLHHMKELFQNDPNFDEKTALDRMNSFFPQLKRWKCTCSDECASGYNPNCTCTSSECHCREQSKQIV